MVNQSRNHERLSIESVGSSGKTGWKPDTFGFIHQQWDWPKESLFPALERLAKGGSRSWQRFEREMTQAFGSSLRKNSDDKSFRNTFRTEVKIGKAAPYSEWEKHFPNYKGMITRTKPLTEYKADAVFCPEETDEAWVIETQFELDYEAIGQALAYQYAFRQVRGSVLDAELKGKNEEEANLLRRLQDRRLLPKIVCLAAPYDFRALCQEIVPQIQVFYCEEANRV